MTTEPIPLEDAQKISERAVVLARQNLTDRGWSQGSIESLVPDAKVGSAGIRTTRHELMYQERGIKPFVMWWVDGRAQALDAKILTPSGWKPMGDLVIGDSIIDPAGSSSVVEGIFPQGEEIIYQITLSDGSSTEATADHLWSVEIQGMRKDQYVWTTKQIAQFIDRNQDRQIASWNYPVRVPSLVPVTYSTGPLLPMPPYTLGALLGDGSIGYGRVSIHSVDKEILYRIEQELPPEMVLTHAGGISYRLAKRSGTGRSNRYIQSLRGLELMGHTCYDKFIPSVYKMASAEDRISLLQGLFDTDGHCDKQGRTSYVSVSLRLVKDVREVILSLGGRCSLSERESPGFNSIGLTGKTSYRLNNVNILVNVFHLSRKAERFVPRDGRQLRRIVEISPTGETKSVQCIKVSAPSQMYVTDDFIPTHNTIPIHDSSGVHLVRGSGAGEPGFVTLPGGVKTWREQKWRHPGLEPKNFMENALNQAIEEYKHPLKTRFQATFNRLKDLFS